MKTKNLLLSVVLLVMLCLVLSVSCSDNIIDEVSDTLVYATFDNRSRATSTYTQTITLKDIGDVYWTYTATKADSAGQTGATTAQTAVKSDYSKGLDGAIGPFSQGLWDFEVFGYAKGTDTATSTDSDKVQVDTDKYYSGLIYQGTVNGVELKNGTQTNPDPINVIINLLTSGTGTFTISNASDFSWQEDSGSAYSGLYLTMCGYNTDDNSVKSETFELEYNETTDKYYFKKTNEKWPEKLSCNLSSGSWYMEFAVVKAETDNTAPTFNSKDWAWSGVKYTFTTSPELLIKVYTGQETTLEAKIIESNLAWGEFNGSVESIKASTVTAKVEENSNTILSSSITPATATSETIDTSDTRATKVTIPTGTKEFSTGSTAAITVTATPIVTANSLFKISANTGAVGAIDLKATVTTTTDGKTSTTEVSSFTSDGTNPVAVTVETYIAKGLTTVVLTHTKDGTTETWNAGATKTTASTEDNDGGLTLPNGDTAGTCYYNLETGQLVYLTTHFSTFLVGADQNIYDEDKGIAYLLKKESDDDNAEYKIYKYSDSSSTAISTVADVGANLVLLDCALSNNVPDDFVSDCTTDEANKKTWQVIHHNCANQKGYFWHAEYADYFSSGYGTKLEPYIITGTTELENTSYFTAGYAYYKVADGIKTIDCSKLKSYYVRILGSLDGNSVKFSNIPGNLFYYVHTYGSSNTIKNFEANFNLEGSLDTASGMIYMLGGYDTTFKNIKITGKIEGGSNSGAFYTYPVVYDSAKPQYTQKVKLKDCSVEAELYAPNGTFGIIAGHPTWDMGTNKSYYNSLVVTCDKTLSELFIGTAFTQKQSDGKSYVTFFNFNNNMISFSSDSKSGIKTDDKKECNSFYTCDPTYSTDNGYSVAWVEGAVRMEVYIAAQFTEADSSGVNTANNGITLGLADWKTIRTSDSDFSENGQNVLGAVNLVDVTLKSSYGATYDSENKKLTASVPWSGPNVYGSIKLQVAQYNSDDKMIAYGTKTIASKSTYNGTWAINPQE